METQYCSHEQLLSFFSNTVKLFLLKGNSYMNLETDEGKRYKEAKTPASTNGKRIEITPQDIEKCLYQDFWIGLEIPPGYILVDIDNKGIGETVADALKESRINNITLQTPNGFQLLFKDSGRVKTQTVKSITPAGITVDYRLSGKGYTILPTPNIADRHIRWLPDAITNMPDLFVPVRTARKDEEDVLDIPVMEGGRNGTMISHAGRIRAWNSKYTLGLDEASPGCRQ
jgi:putative DNA primase/helicase